MSGDVKLNTLRKNCPKKGLLVNNFIKIKTTKTNIFEVTPLPQQSSCVTQGPPVT